MIFVWDRSGGSSFSTNLFIVSINGRSYDQPKDFGVAVMFAVCHEWRFPKMGKKTHIIHFNRNSFSIYHPFWG